MYGLNIEIGDKLPLLLIEIMIKHNLSKKHAIKAQLGMIDQTLNAPPLKQTVTNVVNCKDTKQICVYTDYLDKLEYLNGSKVLKDYRKHTFEYNDINLINKLL